MVELIKKNNKLPCKYFFSVSVSTRYKYLVFSSYFPNVNICVENMLGFGMWGSKWCKQWNVCLHVDTIWSGTCTCLLRWQQVSSGFKLYIQCRENFWSRLWVLVVFSCSGSSRSPIVLCIRILSQQESEMIHQTHHPWKHKVERVLQGIRYQHTFRWNYSSPGSYILCSN